MGIFPGSATLAVIKLLEVARIDVNVNIVVAHILICGRRGAELLDRVTSSPCGWEPTGDRAYQRLPDFAPRQYDRSRVHTLRLQSPFLQRKLHWRLGESLLSEYERVHTLRL